MKALIVRVISQIHHENTPIINENAKGKFFIIVIITRFVLTIFMKIIVNHFLCCCCCMYFAHGVAKKFIRYENFIPFFFA